MEWQPIETAPKDGTLCVFYSKLHGSVVGFIPTNMAHYKKPEAMVRSLSNRRAQQFKPTHWMPLPSPPAS